MESLGHIAVVKEYKRKTEEKREVISWSEFDNLLSQLLKALNTTSKERAMKLLGYAGAGHINKWKKDKAAPVLAKNAVLGLLSELNVAREAVKQPVQRQFNLDDLARILAIISTSEFLGDEAKRKWIQRLAREISTYSE